MRSQLDIVPASRELWPALLDAEASGGGHGAPCTTHIFTRGGQVVGSASMFAPAVFFFAHPARLDRFETFDLIKRCQAMAGEAQPDHLVLCSPASPLHPFMARFKKPDKTPLYQQLGNVDVFRTIP